MPNGDTGRNGWIHRRNDTLWKVAGAIIIPAVGWLMLTVVSHSEELASSGVDLDRTTIATEQAVLERHAIQVNLSRLEERQMQQQRSNDSAHARQDRKLDQIIQRLDR
jgi:hypothetical protein